MTKGTRAAITASAGFIVVLAWLAIAFFTSFYGILDGDGLTAVWIAAGMFSGIYLLIITMLLGDLL